jgi:hypothetical protein
MVPVSDLKEQSDGLNGCESACGSMEVSMKKPEERWQTSCGSWRNHLSAETRERQVSSAFSAN